MKEYRGVIAAASSFFIWGLLPIYWKMLEQVPAYEILCHRMVWSLLLTMGLILAQKKAKVFFAFFFQKKYFFYFLLTALLLSFNWFIFIWSVNSGLIIEASLGYFINPLVSVCFGVIFLKEKMRAGQWISLFIAFMGVTYLTWSYGHFPWIAISLASTFACYGILHKITPVPSLEGLCMETAILFLPAMAFLLFTGIPGGGAFVQGGMSQTLLLMGTGIVTSIPLLCFCYAAQKVPLYLVGLLQYIAPTMNLIVGIYLYGEDFSRERMVGFVIIWTALAVFVAEGLARQLRAHRTARQLGHGC